MQISAVTYGSSQAGGWIHLAAANEYYDSLHEEGARSTRIEQADDTLV